MTGLVLLCALLVAGADGTAPFRAVEIDPRFEGYLRANPLLMAVPGAKVIRLDNGNEVVLAVASTVLKDDSADERQRAEKVCKLKALASVVAEKQGVQLAHVEQVKEQTVVVLENCKESGHSVTEVLQVTTAQFRASPTRGRWWGGGSRRTARCSSWPSTSCGTERASRCRRENRPARGSSGRADRSMGGGVMPGSRRPPSLWHLCGASRSFF
jgi:hypothetical protein